MKPLTLMGFLFMFCVSLQQTVAFPRQRLDHDKRKERRLRMRNDPCQSGSDEANGDPFLMEGGVGCVSTTPPVTNPCPPDDEANLDPFLMEGVGGGVSCVSATPQVIDFEEAALDRQVLGLPGWKYITVSLVIMAVTGIGGAIAIVCKKCGVLFGRRAENDKDETH